MSSTTHNSPFNSEDNFDSSFQLETNDEFNKIIQSVTENEKDYLFDKSQSVNLSELLAKDKDKLDPLNDKENLVLINPRYQSPSKDRFSRVSLISDHSGDGKFARKRLSTMSSSNSSINKKLSNNSLKNRLSMISNNSNQQQFVKNVGRYSLVSSSSDTGKRFERSFSNDSSFIGYRNSIRSNSTLLGDNSVQYFDAVSIDDDDMESDILDAGIPRFSQLKASPPGIVGVSVISKNRHINDITETSHDDQATVMYGVENDSKSTISPLPSPSEDLLKNQPDESNSVVSNVVTTDKQSANPSVSSPYSSPASSSLNLFNKNFNKSMPSFDIKASTSNLHNRNPSNMDKSIKAKRSFILLKNTLKRAGSTRKNETPKDTHSIGSSSRLEKLSTNHSGVSKFSGGSSEVFNQAEPSSSFTKKLFKFGGKNKALRNFSISSRKSFESRKSSDNQEVDDRDYDSFKFKFHKRSMSFGFRGNNSSSSINNSSSASINEQPAVIKDYNELLTSDTFTSYSNIFFNALPARKLAADNNMDYSDLHKLMNLCNSSNNLLVDFEDFIQLRLREVKDKYQFKSFHSLKHTEIFLERSLKSKKNINMMKIIPVNAQCTVHDVVQEMTIINKLQNCQGFINLKYSIVVKGEFSKSLLKEWDFNNINSFNICPKPDHYSSSQIYLIQVFEYGGTSLKDFKVQNWQQANKLFWNLTKILKTSELLYNFEHRNLTWDNILVSIDEKQDLKLSIIDFSYSRISDKTGRNLDSIKDTNPQINDTYKRMKALVQKNWAKSTPKTNVLWLYYILDLLINDKNLTPITETPGEVNTTPTINTVRNFHRSQHGPKSILRNNSKVNHNDLNDEIIEYKSYQALQYAYNSLNPRHTEGSGGFEPFFKSMLDDFGDLFKMYKDEHFRETVRIEHFDNLDQVLKWGELNELLI